MNKKDRNMKKTKLNAETIKAIEDAKNGIWLSKGYINLDEMWKDLEKYTTRLAFDL